MTAKENALQIIRFGTPEWVAGGLPSYTLCYQGCNHEGYSGGGHHCPVGTRWTDIWGTEWHKEHDGVMGFPRGNPLAEMSALPSYAWPDPDDERIRGKIDRLAEEYPGGDLFLAGSHRDTLWEKSYMLVGMENMMAYLLTEPDYAREVLHRIMDFQLGIARHYLRLDVEMVACGDDLGTQHSALLNPELFEEFFVPEYTRLFDLYHEHGMLINFHSCGNILPMLDIFLRLGIHILNPLQAEANDLAHIRERTQGKMALHGAVSTRTIMDGPPERITAEVRQRLWELGRDGGYFCAPDQGMPFPPEHLAAYQQALEEYGRYPLMEYPGEIRHC